MASSEKSKSAVAQTAANDVFDVRRVRRLVELMKENDLTELNIQQGDLKIQLQRAAATVPVCAPVHAPAPAVSMPPPVAPPAAVASLPVAEDPNILTITSPMVGTFYTAADPQSPPFIKVGDTVGPEKTVCLIEAMKVFNEIQAETAGKIVAVLAQNGQPVEFGTPLFKIDTRG
ncbi:MAG TPA: acetyl-CoA carboxylase biotin carboxyl carrier protein [Planctomycetaceae bacterium]|nr:acetyl-CoA carboxylase biotin carboxyl carrier protein [Planctomycetaceae bacterium]